MRKILTLLIVQHIRQRPIRTVLTIVGIAVGVSAWLAIRLVNIEIWQVFENSVTRVVGETTIRISGGTHGFDERLIQRVRQHPAVMTANPVVEISGTITTGTQSGTSLLIWGMDLIEFVNNGTIISPGQETSDMSLDNLLEKDALFIGTPLADRWGLARGDRVEVKVGSQIFRLHVRGMVSPSSTYHHSLDYMAIMGIASAQMLFHRQGRLNAINLVTSEGSPVEQVIDDLRQHLPDSLRIATTARSSTPVKGMLRAFQFNLTMLSAIGLLVGMFLVYNTVSFSVVQHRREIGILRTLGMSRAQISILFLLEGGIAGCIGGLLGCGLGGIMAHVVMDIVSQSVSDLYAPVTIHSIGIHPLMVLEGGAIGIGISMLGSLRPCLEAGATVPVRALSPGDYEVQVTANRNRLAWGGMGLFLLSGLLTIPQPINGIPFAGYLSAFLLLVGCTLFGPIALQHLGKFMNGRAGKHVGLLGNLAAGQVVRSPGRNSVTLSALVIGLSIMVGVGVMIRSFRHTVELWVDQTLMADLIVAPFSWMSETANDNQPSGLPIELVERIRSIPGVADVDPYRQTEKTSGDTQIQLVSRDLRLHAQYSQYLFEEGSSRAIIEKTLARNGVIVSEVLGERLGVTVGQTLPLVTPTGIKTFPILGIFYDYATDGGKAVMDQRVYRRFWKDQQATVLAVYAKPGADTEGIRRHITNTIGRERPITTISHQELRAEILTIFDRTFYVTYVLELIALAVALLGIINTLVTSILERQREFATLRAIGASAGQIRGMVFWESGYLAFLGAILGISGGLALSGLLIKVINKQSFGWTILFDVPGTTVLEAVCLAVLAALLSGYVPARWAARQSIADGLRYE